jgi:hypothetical protein|tara:strand:+ start:4270 stop:5415 length:1146 start_codon:yes stop_codon:yes gene_type:complete
MACLNSKDLFYLQTYDSKNTSKILMGSNPAENAKLKLNLDYVYIQFSGPNSFECYPLDTVLDHHTILKLQFKKIYLVLDNSLEYFYESVDAIYKHIVNKYNIPASQIVFLSGVPTMLRYTLNYCKKNNAEQIKIMWYSLFETTGKDTIRQRKTLPTLEKKRKYTKKFLNLNRRWRLHRPLLVTMLYDRGLLDEGYVSLAPSDDRRDWKQVWNWLSKKHYGHKEITKILKRSEGVQQLPPMYLDEKDLVTNRAEHQTSIESYYQETFFSVVSETTFYENVPFLSEKIFKTIAMGHPFILVGSPNTLQYLKKLGYRTFAPYINEHYDSIEDHGDRAIAIVDEIERICKLNKAEWREWMSKVRPIAEHNYKILYRRQQLIKPMN